MPSAMTWVDIAIGVAIGLVSGVLAGSFGVGGGILMTRVSMCCSERRRSWRWPRLFR